MVSDQTAAVPAGWYPDPYGVSEMRWWDGQNWTDSIHPPPTPEPDTPPVFAPPQPESLIAPAAAGINSPQVADPQGLEPDEPRQQELPSQELPSREFPSQEFPSQELPSHEVQPQDPQMIHEDIGQQDPHDEVPTETPSETLSSTAQATRLPSRREMRLRNEMESAQAASSVSAFSELTPPPLTEPEPQSASTSAEVTFAELSDPSETSTPPLPEGARSTFQSLSDPVASHESGGFGAGTGAVPDSSTPTTFDWLPGANTGGLNSPPQRSGSGDGEVPSTVSPSVASTQDAPAATSPVTAFDNQQFGDSTDSANPWAQAPQDVSHDIGVHSSTATRKVTTSSWFIAAMPLLAGILSIAAVKGQENYPNYVPTGVEWWMLVVGVLVALYVVTLILAMADRNKLDWAGYNQPAHWAWALLTAPVYLLVRTIAVKRETGRTSILLVVWFALLAILVGAWFAAEHFAPELISGYVLPFL